MEFSTPFPSARLCGLCVSAFEPGFVSNSLAPAIRRGLVDRGLGVHDHRRELAGVARAGQERNLFRAATALALEHKR